MDDRGAFTIPEFCAWSRIGRTKVYELIAAGELPIVKIGKRTLIRCSDGRALLEKFVTSEAGASPRKEGERDMSAAFPPIAEITVFRKSDRNPVEDDRSCTGWLACLGRQRLSNVFRDGETRFIARRR